MRKPSLFLNSILWSCAILLGLSLAVSYCSVYINPIHFWIPAFFGLYFVPLVLVNALFFIITLLRRSNAAWIPFITLLPTLLFIELFIRWGAVEEVRPAVSLKIATYNVCNFQGAEKKRYQETINDINALLDREHIDIVCMQEFFCPDTGKIGELFPSFPFRCFSQNVQKTYRGNLILSRYPVAFSGELLFPGNHRNCIFADYQVHGREFRVYTTHFESNKISLNAIVDRLRNYQEAPDEILQAHWRIREAFRIRSQQVSLITDHLQKVEMPFIFCGDFNDTPVSFTYHQLQRGLNDSFRNAGRGFGATFRYLWPTLRIDYILYNQAFTAKSHVTKKVPFSDHYPVIVELILL